MVETIAGFSVTQSGNRRVRSIGRASVPLFETLGTEALLVDYIEMQGHLNRKQFTRCAWSAALMLVGSAAAIIGAIGYLAK
jgi:hypothetical protein